MKFLHTMIRVEDLNKSITFYKEVLNLDVIRSKEVTEGEYTLVFLGYGKEEKDIAIELTYNWKTKKYNVGDGFGHIAFSVNDLAEICTDAETYGGTIKRQPGLLKTSAGKDVAFITDPDGYIIELIAA